MSEEPQVSTGLTARVADSYGPNPHEHKPSQDPWAPDDADEKQAETGDAGWDGTSYSTSETGTESSQPKKQASGSKRAPNAGSRSAAAPKDSSTARSTDTSSKE